MSLALKRRSRIKLQEMIEGDVFAYRNGFIGEGYHAEIHKIQSEHGNFVVDWQLRSVLEKPIQLEFNF